MKFLSYALVTVFAGVCEGWVLKMLWQWFIAGPFHIYRLSVPQAVGVATLVGLLAGNTSTKEDLSPWDLGLAVVLNCTTALVVGWICYMLTW